MLRCPHCNFLSDPKTGNIFDARFPCPQCGKKTEAKKPIPMRNVRAATCHINPKGSSFGATAKPSKLIALLKTVGYGAGFYFSYAKLDEIDDAQDSRNRKLKAMLGPMLPALKTTTYMIPILAVPEITSVVTGKDRPLIHLAFQVAVILGMVKVLSNPFTKALNADNLAV